MAVSFRQDTNKPKVIPYFPTKSYGKEGDIIISKISGRGVFLCIKASGVWYSQTSMQPLQKINTSYIKNLSSDKMTIKNLQNSKINTDKFIISENGDIKYRTANQILSDLGLEGINSFDIDYKTAYCSLQQYSNKETCESNGGVWYYSENDSHDSISSTPENQLLTVSQSVGNVDAEPTLLYDGSTLNIKYNSDYDDNWQTSAQTNLLKLSYNSTDSLQIAVAANGASTISTNDNDGAAGHLTLDANGDLTLDSHSGNFIAKKAGTEFSVANSAYAGMILGYRMIGEDNTHESYTMTTSYAVPDADITVRFIAPPSGCVEVMVQIHANASSSNRIVYFGLSDNATYNSIGDSYEQMHRMPDETDDEVCQHYWTITGLTAGSTYNYWFGARASLANAFLNWGGTAVNRYADFIMKVTALPAATSDFAEYD